MERKLSRSNSSILDLIRGISAQLVVIGHGISFCGVALKFHQPNFPWVQNIAVVIFFILSGFVISYSLGRKSYRDDYSFSHYFVDRFVRIYTSFIPVLIFIVVIDFFSKSINGSLYAYNEAFNVKTFISNVFMLQDYPFINFVTSFGSARPLWTVAIEWWIYLFVGALFFTLKNKSKNAFVYFFIVFLSIVPMYNLIGGRGNGLTLYWVYGVMIYYIFERAILKSVSVISMFIMMIALVVMACYRVMSDLQEYDYLFALYIAGVIVLLVEISTRFNFNAIVVRVSTFLASYSYSLYLIHYSIFDFLVTRYGGGYTVFFTAFIFSNVVSYFFAMLFEIYLTNKIKRGIYSFFNWRYMG
ncbi:acyltransferase family protein [Aeromonas sp. HMWF016]|uniref:acyltransferase family protein n=1 Tax=Aeromonas sp. HMWF016 TaxID=2056852 RepID=UPI000D3319DB|nr:acyltransferase [Aeromonas sp. HMWF016]PTT49208.1 acyltransferase [Aeromonas sp. HMWF016]